MTPFAKGDGWASKREPADYVKIEYHSPDHNGPDGKPCHGPNAEANGASHRHRISPWISDNCRATVLKLYMLGVPPAKILEDVRKLIVADLGLPQHASSEEVEAQLSGSQQERDFFITLTDVYNIVRRTDAGKYKYDDRDPVSVHIWATHHKEWYVACTSRAQVAIL